MLREFFQHEHSPPPLFPSLLVQVTLSWHAVVLSDSLKSKDYTTYLSMPTVESLCSRVTFQNNIGKTEIAQHGKLFHNFLKLSINIYFEYIKYSSKFQIRFDSTCTSSDHLRVICLLNYQRRNQRLNFSLNQYGYKRCCDNFSSIFSSLISQFLKALNQNNTSNIRKYSRK